MCRISSSRLLSVISHSQRITSNYSKNFDEDLSAQSWQDVTPDERAQMCASVQQDLKTSGLPQIHENIVRWRLSQVSSEKEKSADGST